MTEKQKDQSNQQADSKSHQEHTQEGKKKEEINPNNPKANQNNHTGTHQGNQQHQNATKIKVEAVKNGVDTEHNDSEETRKTDAGKTGNKNSKKENS